MAELHVQKKEQSVWPWILAAVIVLALLFWWLSGRDADPNVAVVDDTDSTVVATTRDTDMMDSAMGSLGGAAAMDDFQQFVDARSSRAAGVAHDYTADGLRRLASAMRQVAMGDSVGGVALQPRIDEIRDRADALQRNANSSDHALQTREAFVLASGVLSQMHGDRGGATGDMDALENAATAIEPSRPLLDQADRIEEFFDQAGQALRALNSGNM